MISDTLKNRLTKDRPMTSITLRIPVDVVESMKSIAYMDSSRFASIYLLLDWGTTAHVYPAFDLSAMARAIMGYSRVCS